ncbi:hypothetical protein QD46_25340 [Paenibacillus polymyxa]|uniref:non-ribosomal peptide synthetase n=1 Tax=Paenibacillus polymyxa TaxID=1406 RepID=UPI0005CF01C9|nr:non-ribosomal peptide synthetase [Paenibacillus polymyxa]KJD37367.1 hypothetical protein QD46_25340 [Paenibacillus polymyxa]
MENMKRGMVAALTDGSSKHTNFWTNILDPEVLISTFPYDFELSSETTLTENKLKEISRVLPLPVTSSLNEMSGKSELGTYMILLSGVMYLLARYTGSEDLVIAAPKMKPKNGSAYINEPILLRSCMKPQLTVREWLTIVKDTVSDAFKHQSIAFARMAEYIGIVTDPQGKHVVETLVQFDSIHSTEEMTNIHAHTRFRFFKMGGHLAVKVSYYEELFNAGTLERLLDALFMYLEGIIQNSEMYLYDIPLLTKKNLDEIMYEFNPIQTDTQLGGITVDQLIQPQLLARSDQVALIFDNRKLTYREINEQANQLARYISQKNMEKPVAVYMGRSPFILPAILGILKAGTTYVPIDPMIPTARSQSIIEEAGISIIVTTSVYKKFLSTINDHEGNDPIMLCLDTDDISDSYCPATYAPLSPDDERLAYIIFTSGSTGKPKGVEIQHKAVVAFLDGINEVIKPALTSVMLNVTSLSFDIFMVESLYCLLHGITIVMASDQENMDPVEIERLVRQHNVDLAQLTPSRLQLLLNHPSGREALSRLNKILIGGEEFTQQALKQLRTLTSASIINVYGPTEATVWATAAELNESDVVTIGRPLNNYACYIIDDFNHLQPVGAIGELAISGKALAKGYLNNPEQTALKFIQNPLQKNERLYKTGDRARWTSSGMIQCLGRADNQVKVGGYRIELGDIEVAILSHPDILEAKVIVKPNESGELLLVAYLVSDHSWTMDAIHKYLQSKLPNYMIPARIFQIPVMPLSVSGKADTAVLKGWSGDALPQNEYRAPENEVQLYLSEVWKNILNLKRVGIKDDFFQIGGSSLSAIKMIAHLSDQYTVSINDIFAYPTIEQLSLHVAEQQGYFQQIINEMKNAPIPKRDNMDSLLQYYRSNIQLYDSEILKQRKKYENIFLTGGTGFLGCHLIYELLHKTTAQLTLLVRPVSGEIPENRVRNRMRCYFEQASDELRWDRVTIIAGDLTEPRLGLSQERYEQLARETDCIIHAGALIKHYGTVKEFNEINVSGTQAVIDLAKVGQSKDLHHISTVSIGIGSELEIFHEFTEENGNVDNLYLQSKGEAEALIRQERKNGLSCTIYRLNSLHPSKKLQKFMINKEGNGFNNFVKGLAELQLYPDLNEPVLDLTGADQAAEAIVKLFDHPAVHNLNHHIFNPNRISWAGFAKMLHNNNNSFQLVPYAIFIQNLADAFEQPATRNSVINVILNLFLLRNTQIIGYARVCEQTQYILTELGFSWGAIDMSQVEIYKNLYQNTQ